MTWWGRREDRRHERSFRHSLAERTPVRCLQPECVFDLEGGGRLDRRSAPFSQTRNPTIDARWSWATTSTK